MLERDATETSATTLTPPTESIALFTSNISPSSPVASLLSTHKVYYYVSQRETVVAWTAKAGFELYAVLDPLVSKYVAIQACNSLLRWINTEETNLFILASPVW
jgi:hypothetical protein